MPIIVPPFDHSIQHSGEHLLKYNTVRSQVKNYFTEKSLEREKCHHADCKKTRLKTTIRNAIVAPIEGFIVKPCKKLLLERENNYLDLGEKDIRLKDDNGVSNYLPVCGIRDEFGYFEFYLKKDKIWWKFSNSEISPQVVPKEELGYCDYIFYAIDSLDPYGELSESSE